MADMRVNGLESEVLDKLADQYGSSWTDLAEKRWGSDWAEPCRQDLAAELGSGWESEPVQEKVEAMSTLLAPEAEQATADGGGSDEQPVPSLDDTPWIAMLADAGSFPDWLAWIGVDVAVIAGLGQTAPAQGEAEVPSLDATPWIATLADAGSFPDWLVRMGVDASVVAGLTEGGSGPVGEKPPSLDATPWIATLAEAGSFEDWLVRIGVSAEQVASLQKNA